MSQLTAPERPRDPVVVVTGPTASGKSAIAVELACRFDAEIINADSMQIYRFMDIGTAKPSLEERARVAHHLFDIVSPDERYSAGRYARDAREVARTIHARGKLVILVGGTGLYIRAFNHGLIDSGGEDLELRGRLEQEHAQACREGEPTRLHDRLAGLDPEAAERIHPNDLRRTVRALEISQQVGEPASLLRRRHSFQDRPYPTLHLALHPGRDRLYERIDARCREMIDRGLLQEVRMLRERGYGPELASMQAIGYRHIQPVVDGSDTLVNALSQMQRDTRRFARRQLTWLRAVRDVHWLDPDDGREIFSAVERFLQTKPSGEPF